MMPGAHPVNTAGRVASAMPEAGHCFEFFHDLVDDRAGDCAADHVDHAELQIRFVKVRVALARFGPVVIDTAQVVLEERARSGAGDVRGIRVSHAFFEILVDQLLPGYRQSRGQSVHVLVGEGWADGLATVGTERTVDVGRHLLG